MSNKEINDLDDINCLMNSFHNNFNSEDSVFNVDEIGAVEQGFAFFISTANTDLESLNIKFEGWDGAITFSDAAIKNDKDIIELVKAALDFGLT